MSFSSCETHLLLFDVSLAELSAMLGCLSGCDHLNQCTPAIDCGFFMKKSPYLQAMHVPSTCFRSAAARNSALQVPLLAVLLLSCSKTCNRLCILWQSRKCFSKTSSVCRCIPASELKFFVSHVHDVHVQDQNSSTCHLQLTVQ